MKIVFPYIAHLHQVPHSLPIALEIARHHRDVEVHVACAGEAHRVFIERLAADYAPEARLHLDQLSLDPLSRRRVRSGQVPLKLLALFANRSYFNRFDAIAIPERTSLRLRSMGVQQPRLIWTRHGAGDREIGFAADVRDFDFVLMAGRRIERRLLEQKLIRPGAYAVGVYAKFDWLRAAQTRKPRLFDNDRPTVLYNPHFVSRLSSWPEFGMRILEQFAASTRYNLIFAPHLRLFDPPSARRYQPFKRFMNLPHLHVDLGSERSIDMSYTTRAADLYLGDVSSQVAEFLAQPRPCLFLNAHRVRWHGDPSYDFWRLGPVTESVDAIEQQVDAAFAAHVQYAAVQQGYLEETFELPAGRCSAARGADAIVEYLRAQQRRETAAMQVLPLAESR